MNEKCYEWKTLWMENIINGTLWTEHYKWNVINGTYTQIFYQSVCWGVKFEQNTGYWIQTLRNKLCQTLMLGFTENNENKQKNYLDVQKCRISSARVICSALTFLGKS